jgi:hypothetical protein
MKYIKLFESYILENWNVNPQVEIGGEEHTIKWSSGELELSEIIQAFSQRKDLIPKDWDSFKSVFNYKYPDQFSNQKDTNENDINIGLKSSYNSGNVDIKYTSADLLKIDKFTIDGKEVDAKPYHDFIKGINKVYWSGGKKQLSESELKSLAKEVENEEGRVSFANVINDSNFMNKLKKYFDKVLKTKENPSGVPIERFGTTKVKVDYPDMWDDYEKALQYYEYFQKTFDFMGDSIQKGEELALPSVISVNNKMLLLGGNRRITYCVINNILPFVHFIKI